MLRGVAQGWSEVTNAEPGQGALHAVYKPRAFLDQALALPIGPLGVLFGNRRHARHSAMAPFATQPPQEPALQQLGVEPVGFSLGDVRAIPRHSRRQSRIVSGQGGHLPEGRANGLASPFSPDEKKLYVIELPNERAAKILGSALTVLRRKGCSI